MLTIDGKDTWYFLNLTVMLIFIIALFEMVKFLLNSFIPVIITKFFIFFSTVHNQKGPFEFFKFLKLRFM